MGSSELSVIMRLRETVSAKLASFEASNRALRLQLRERQRHDLNAARLVEQRDLLLKVCPPSCSRGPASSAFVCSSAGN